MRPGKHGRNTSARGWGRPEMHAFRMRDTVNTVNDTSKRAYQNHERNQQSD